MTSKQILRQLNKLGYVVQNNEYSKKHRYLLKKGGKTYTYDLSVLIDPLPYCCGVEEIGEVTIQDINYVDVCHGKGKTAKASSARYVPLILFIQYYFLELKERNTHKKSRIPLIFNGNGIDESLFVEVALKRLPQDFKLVSQSINPQSRNRISTFISK